jgi:hypothetical protein
MCVCVCILFIYFPNSYHDPFIHFHQLINFIHLFIHSFIFGLCNKPVNKNYY